MPRPKRFTPAGCTQHIVQRGNNKKTIFHQPRDFYVFLKYLRELSEKHQVAIHAWVLMSNHFHLLCTPTTNNGISKMMQFLASRYAQFYNAAYNETGALWEGRFRASLISSEKYLLRCYQYIELNPVRAGVCTAPEKYLFSSHHYNAFDKSCNITQPHPRYLAIATTKTLRLLHYQDLFKPPFSEQDVKSFRTAIKKNSKL